MFKKPLFWVALIGVLIIIGVKVLSWYNTPMIIKSEEFLLSRRHELNRLRIENLNLHQDRSALKRDKENLKEEILKRDQRIEQMTVSAPDKTETIIVNKVEYVPKIEYVKVYEKLQLSDKLRKALGKYLILDDKIGINVEASFTNLHAQMLKLEEMNNHLTGLRNAAAKKKKRFALVLGIGSGFTFSGHSWVGVGVVAGIVIK